MKNYLYIFSIITIAIISSCATQTDRYDATQLDSTALEAITESSYKQYVADLASDEFMGRKPFTKGDTLAVNYIEKQFKEIGLLPGNGSSYFQEVPMVEIISKPTNSALTFTGQYGSFSVKNLDDFVIGTRKIQENIDIKATDLVFAGFGIVAPEFGWNDYEGIDVKGKTVVVMVSDPGLYDNSLFKADTMSYYGRWTYKYEEAGRQGAAGILLIHDIKGASYGWDVVRSGWSGAQLNIISDEPVPYFEGWISAQTAQHIFKIAGLNASVIESAKKKGFKAITLPVKTDISLQNTYKYANSNNVIAKIEGSKRPEETIIYTAHWDHLGIGEPVNGDSIYNGAIDNAAGVSALFEIAKAFKAAKIKPERSIIFIALTGEEEGLLGSSYYANNPIYPLNKMVANLNMDAFNPLGATKDISIVGYGQTEIDDYVERSAAKFGRIVRGEKNPTSGGFYRSDHFSFVLKGVPGLFMGSGSELISIDSTSIKKRMNALSGRYHAPSDQVDENWDFHGILEDIRLFFDVGYTLSQENTFPQFKEKSEFRKLGEKRLSK